MRRRPQTIIEMIARIIVEHMGCDIETARRVAAAILKELETSGVLIAHVEVVTVE